MLLNQEIHSSRDAAIFIHDYLNEGEVLESKILLKELKRKKYVAESDGVFRQFASSKEMENNLKEYPSLLMIENHRITKYTQELKDGKEGADHYFFCMLMFRSDRHVYELEEDVDLAPSDVNKFMETFYSENNLIKYFKKRPHLYRVKENHVSINKEANVGFFMNMMITSNDAPYKHAPGAPEHIREYLKRRFPQIMDHNCTPPEAFPETPVDVNGKDIPANYKSIKCELRKHEKNDKRNLGRNLPRKSPSGIH